VTKPPQCPHCKAPESYLEAIKGGYWCSVCAKVVRENSGAA
jgi:hypothetical protein